MKTKNHFPMFLRFLPSWLLSFSLLLGLLLSPAALRAANRFAIAAGNYNDTAIWSTTAGGAGGASYPVNGDVAYANGFAVAGNVNSAATSVRNDVNGSGATTGGTFTLADGVTLTAAVFGSNTAVTCVTYAGNGANSATITGAITPQAGGASCVTMTGTGTLIIGGAVVSGSAAGAHGVTNSSSGTVTITGNLTPSSTASIYCVNNTGTGLVTINGNVICNNGGPAITNTSTGTITIVGDISGTTTTSAAVALTCTTAGFINITGNISCSLNGQWMVNLSGNCTVVIIGNMTGTTGNGGGCFQTTGASAVVSITGNITGGSGTSTGGVVNITNGSVTIVGTLTAGGNAPAVACSSSTATVVISGSLIGASNGTVAVYSLKYRISPTPTNAKIRQALNGTTTYSDFFTADNSLGQAAIADVRKNTVYASGSLTGTAYIPAAASVAYGVNVDATTGTATLSAQNIADAVQATVPTGKTVAIGARLPDVATGATGGVTLAADSSGRADITQAAANKAWETPTSGLTTSGSIGARAKNAATVDATGAQIAAGLTH
jgi:hypothetical protein